MVDLILNFFTAYFDDKNHFYVFIHRRIISNYLSTWFTVDLLSSLPFDLMLHGLVSSSNVSVIRVLKTIRLLRVIKVIKLLNISMYIDKIENYLEISPVILELLGMLLLVFFISHCVGCILWGISNLISNEAWFQTITWYPYYDGDSTRHVDVSTVRLNSKYTASIYWAITIVSTTGYGDFKPVNTGERLLVITIIVFAASIFGYMIASVGNLFDNLNPSNKIKIERVSGILEFLDEKNCSSKIMDKVTQHFKQLYSDYSDTEKILSRLPQRLSNEVQLHHHGQHVKAIAILNYIDNISVRLYIYQLLKRVYYQKHQVIINQGDHVSCISFIVKGSMVAFRKLQRKDTIDDTIYQSKKIKKSKKIVNNITRRFSFNGMDKIVNSSSEKNGFGSSRNNNNNNNNNNRGIMNLISSRNSQESLLSVDSKKGDKSHHNHYINSTNLLDGSRNDNITTVKQVSGSYYTITNDNDNEKNDTIHQNDEFSYEFFPGYDDNDDDCVVAQNNNLINNNYNSNIDGDSSNIIKRLFHRSSTGKFNVLPDTSEIDGSKRITQLKDRIPIKNVVKDNHGDGIHNDLFSDDDNDDENAANDDDNLDMIDDDDDVFVDKHTTNLEGITIDLKTTSVKAALSLASKKSSSSSSKHSSFKALMPSSSSSTTTATKRTMYKKRKELLKKKSSAFFHFDDDFDNNNNPNTSRCFNSNSPININDDDQFDYNADELYEQGFDHIGLLQKGDFFGHLSLMNTNRLHKSYIVATSNCTVYELSKSEISKVLNIEPTVAIQLQQALSQAIATQSDLLGKEHMRERRARKLLKFKQLYKKRRKADGISRDSISSIKVKTFKNMKNNLRSFSDVSNHSIRSSNGTPVDGCATTAVPAATTTITTTTVGIGSNVNKGVDLVLTKATVLYNSDDDKDMYKKKFYNYKSNYNERNSEINNNNNNINSSDNVNSEMIERKSRSIMIHRSHVPSSYKYRAIFLKNMLTNNNSTTTNQTILNSRKSKSWKYFTRINSTISNTSEVIIREPKRRAMSTSDIMMLDYIRSPFEVRLIDHWSNGSIRWNNNTHKHIITKDDDVDHNEGLVVHNNNSSSGSSKDDLKTDNISTNHHIEEDEGDDNVFIPIFPNIKALRNKQHIVRRQSFPSIDNDIWKINSVCKGVC